MSGNHYTICCLEVGSAPSMNGVKVHQCQVCDDLIRQTMTFWVLGDSYARRSCDGHVKRKITPALHLRGLLKRR